MTALVVVQWLHVVVGALWFGAQGFVALILWPALLRVPAPQARATFAALGPVAGPVMAVSGVGLIALGLLRGTWLGPVRSLEALATPYGATFVAALALTVFAAAYGGKMRARLATHVFDGDAWRPGAARFLHRHNAVMLGSLTGVILCMVLMRFGW